MRIGFDAKRLYCNFTGLGNYSRTLLRSLQENFPNDEYFLYTPKVKKVSETDFFLDNSSFHTVVSKAPLKALWRSYSMNEQLQNDGIDLYHGLSHEIPFGIRKSNVKSIVTIHDLIFKIYPKTYPAFDRKLYEVKFKYSCENADRIIAISESTKRDIVRLYNTNPDKIDVVYQSCSPLYFKEEEDLDPSIVTRKYNLPKEYLLSVGSVEERKNLKLIINSYQYLEKAKWIPLVVIGNGKKYKEEVLELIQSLGLEKMVIWPDRVSNQELKAIYQAAQALVYPSFYEGFGLPVAEALLCKTPVITSNVSSLPEAGGPNSIYIDPNSAQDLAKAIARVLSDEELKMKMISEGYTYAINKFSSKNTSQAVMNSYKKVLSISK